MDPGYIKGYVPGVRENGGQYTHAAVWAAMAFAHMGKHDRAWELARMINPASHTGDADAVQRYKVEPYVLAADVYSVAPHIGRGGWTWYTGSAAWMYRAGIEGILGIRREGDIITIEPRIPRAWPGFEATIKLDSSRFDISVANGAEGGVRATLDGSPIDCIAGKARVRLDGGSHRLSIQIG